MISRLAPAVPAIRPAVTAPAAPAARPSAPHVALDQFVGPVRSATEPRPADGLRAYGELSAGQKGLLGPDGAAVYGRLDPEKKAIFLLLSQRLEHSGVDLTGLRLKDPEHTIRPNRLLFENDPAALAGFKQRLEGAVSRGQFTVEPPFSLFHPGMSDWGVRQNRLEYSVQVGMGKDGAFVDVDHFNPSKGWLGQLGHILEIITPGKPPAEKIAREVGEDIWSHLPAAGAQAAA